jgi:hypothetical protein
MHLRIKLLLAAVLAAPTAPASQPLPFNCGDFDKKVAAVETEFENRATGYIVLRNSEFAYALIFTRDKSSLDRGLYWAIFEKGPMPFIACLAGQGRSVTPLMSLHEAKGSVRFGLSGTGLPRCSHEKGGGVQVRMSASIELGPSTIFHFGEGERHAYTLLMNGADRWILLQQNDGRETCYFDRGEASIHISPSR